MNFKVGKSKKLAIAACLLGGMFLGNTAAASDAVYHSPIRGGMGIAEQDLLDFDKDFYPDNVVVGEGEYVFAKDSLVDVDGDKTLELQAGPSPISGAIYIKHKHGPESISVKAEKKLTLQIDAEYGAFAGINDTKMGTKLNVTAGEEGYVIVNSGLHKGGSVPTDPYDCKKGVGIDAGFNTENVKINVSAPITLNVGGRTGSIGIRAGRDSVVNITNDLEINLNNKTKEAYAFQMLRNNSKVNVNYADGGVKDAAVKTAVTGDIYTEETAFAYGDKKTGAEVNMGLSGKDSFFKGAVLYKEGIKSYGDFSDEEDRDVYSAGKVRLALENGASWINEMQGEHDLGTLKNRNGQDVEAFKGSRIYALTGSKAEDASSAGVIYQKDSRDIIVENYSGNTVVFYEHNAEKPAEIIGGDFVINYVDDAGKIKLVTDNKGLNFADASAEDEKLASETMNALAGKLLYTTFQDEALTGEVEIAEGLTLAAKTLKKGSITFNNDASEDYREDLEAGRGFYQEGVKEDGGSTDGGNVDENGGSTDGGDVDENGGSTDGGDVDENGGSTDVVEDLTLTEAITDNYKLTGDTTVNINKATLPVNGRNRHAVAIYNASMHSKGNPMVVDLNNHALDINVDFTKDTNWNQARGIFVDNNTYVNLTNSAPDKAVNISIKNDAGCSSQAIYLNNGTHLKIDSDVNIKEVSVKGDIATAIQVQGQTAALEINGDLTIKDVFAKGRRSGEKSVSGIKVVGSEHSKVVVNGLVDIRGIKGAALRNEGSNSYIGVGGGVIEAAENKALDKAYRAVEVGQGTSAINMQGEEAGNNTVQITGNMFTTGEFKKEVVEYSGGKKFREVINHGMLNVALVNSESFWKGALTYAEYTDYYGEDHSGGFTRVEQGDFNMYLQNGASWTNELQAAALTKLEAQKSEWKGSRVNKLIGGSDKAHAGVIFQKDANDISVNDYSGNTVVFYEHKADAPTEMIGGDFVITKAADNSYVKLVTDSKGLNFADAAADGRKYVKAANVGEAANNAKDANKVSAADKNLASETMNALAAKLLYTANDGKLSGEVEIAEGLTTEAKQLKIGDISFRTEDNEEEGYKAGQGWYEYEVEKEDPDKEKPEIDVPDKEDPDKGDPDKEKPEIDVPDKEDPDKGDPDKEKPEINVPDKEDGIDTGKKKTDAIAGTESAMTTSMLAWRAGLSDMNERVGDLRYGTDAGIWARATGGKVKYENKGAEFSNSFKGIEVGADRKLANGWYVGGAFNYSDGDAKYKLGGTGDPKMYMFNAYGTKINDDGSYLDVTAKVGRVENEFTTYSQYRLMELKGDYHSTGYGLSVEYGKRFGDGEGWFEPQAQLSFGRLGAADYTATTDGGASMDIHQDGMNSVIGRLGVAAGTENEKGSLYVKASLLHEFSGDMTSTTYEAEKAVAFDTEFDDTWGELALGGTYKMSDNSYLYGDFVKSFGGDYEVDWKVNAGLRFSF